MAGAGKREAVRTERGGRAKLAGRSAAKAGGREGERAGEVGSKAYGGEQQGDGWHM
jgi:hypothetical protein